MLRRAFALTLALAAFSPAAASAEDPAQPAIDHSVLKGIWNPVGFFKPGDPLPGSLAPPAPDAGGLFNPSGHWSAYDTNVYETLNYPTRQANDKSDKDPLGSGDPRYGFCPPSTDNPEFNPYGKCVNHSLEYIAHYERTMKAVLGDFGVVVRRYPFNSGTPGPRPVCCGLSTDQGDSINVMAIVPGSDHPEQMVIFGAHFDQTDTGPASFWDSASGHASMPRIAAIMADYWRKTGTRPSATVIFAPWDQEEAGTLGSQEWLAKNIVLETIPQRVRAYFNDDPCASGFPAYYHGNPAQHVPVVNQLSDPATFADPPRAEAFNKQAAKVIDEFWADIDDKIDTAAGEMDVFTDADRSSIAPALGGLLAFGSDYSNFDGAGVPIFNMFPDILGPHADGSPFFSAEGVSILHTPRDNPMTWTQFTDADQTGMSASDGYMTGMEMCSNINARFMLEPNMGGTATANLDPVAYYEPLPIMPAKGKLVTFDAEGSQQLASIVTRQFVKDADLQYKWSFGDGSPDAFGKVVKHAYKKADSYTSTLTVTNRDSHASDTMSVGIVVGEEGAGDENDPSGQAVDPGLRAQGSTVACQSSVLGTATVKPSKKGLAIGFGASDRQGSADIFQVGPKKDKKVKSLTGTGGVTWNGKGGAKKGTFYVRVVTRGTQARQDSRGFGFSRKSGKFKARKAFQQPDTCDAITVFRLDTPAFGPKRKLSIAFVLKDAGKASVAVYRGKAKKPVKKFATTAQANTLAKFSLAGKKLKKGEYRIVLKAAGATKTLYAART
jgi:hypothetical protein